MSGFWTLSTDITAELETALRRGAGFDPKVLVMCDCTQIPELGPCEHQHGNKDAATTEGQPR